jgi:undecaprenyl-diphosphatase
MRLALALGAESLIVNQGIKRIFRRNRPEVGSSSHPHKIRKPLTSSFPSGHASSAVLAASILSEGSNAAPIYRTLAAIVATSRIHVRAHHASDVIAGAAVGIFFTKLIRAIR